MPAVDPSLLPNPRWFCPEAIHSSLTHGPPPHGLLLHQTHQGSPRMTVYDLMQSNLENILLSLQYSIGREQVTGHAHTQKGNYTNREDQS